jgi:hypothetical protein
VPPAALIRSSAGLSVRLLDVDANDSSGCSGCVSSRDSMVVMDGGASSGADTILESIQLAHRLWLLDPMQEQRQLEAVAEQYGKDVQLFHRDQ